MRPVIVYDGECGFCQGQVARIRRWDRRDAFEYVPRQTVGLVERFPVLASGDFETGMRLICRPDKVYVGADAVYEIARRLRGPRLIAWVYRVPLVHWTCRRMYAWVAANRARLGPAASDCLKCADGEG